MTWYEFLLFVHVSGAIIWIGGGFLFQVHGMVELRSRDTAAIARFAGNAGRIGGQLLIRRVFALLRVDLLFLFAIVFAMTVKPTSDDTWAILVVGAILLAGTAVFLRGMRETGPAGGIAQRDALRGVSALL